MNTARKLSELYFALRSVSWYSRNFIPLAFEAEWRPYYNGVKSKEGFISLFKEKLKPFEEKRTNSIIKELEKYIDSLETGTKGVNVGIEKILSTELDKIVIELEKIPKSIEKAREVLFGLIDNRNFDGVVA